jgi:hypothetical protein
VTPLAIGTPVRVTDQGPARLRGKTGTVRAVRLMYDLELDDRRPVLAGELVPHEALEVLEASEHPVEPGQFL